MNIQTKFDPKDTVWVIFNGKAEKAKVKSISMYGGLIRYELEFPFEVMHDTDYKEERLARTKQELLETL